MLAPTLIKYITSPFLIIQPEYDTWQLPNVLGVFCQVDSKLDQCSDVQIKNISAFRDKHNQLLSESLAQKPNQAAWAIACLDHCYTHYDPTNHPSWQVPMNSGNTIAAVITKFLKGEQDSFKNRWIDEVYWPNNKLCSRMPNEFENPGFFLH